MFSGYLLQNKLNDSVTFKKITDFVVVIECFPQLKTDEIHGDVNHYALWVICSGMYQYLEYLLNLFTGNSQMFIVQ